jgi:alpha-2-macroglobulin
LAANALISGGSTEGFTLNGVPIEGPLVRVYDDADLRGAPVVIANGSGRAATTVLTTFGVPVEPEPAGGNGYRIERSYYTLDGQLVTPDRVALNTRLVAVIKVTPTGDREARLMVNDPLPAGFEIDNPNLLRAGAVSGLDWLDLKARVQHAEFRTERFLAAVDLRGTKPVQLAYIVRAISPGVFYQPAASVEDMYRPAYRARTGAGRVEVVQN